ncbi:MAG: hypothetical protein F6K23_27605 [Okeania sp. SIO2C9]|uniref:hypothetical protein n=1 Tax=Okeania sp. SIO2C9 TaxID=2607791 RepID=UPI0013C1521D|nr:hypothetical protein [Okeania sp. SIO2C9]NEQ76469.1 hypothetical protein [Okeania sp. SIO2C9]
MWGEIIQKIQHSFSDFSSLIDAPKDLATIIIRRQLYWRQEGRGKREEGRGKREEGRGKREEGRCGEK